jgi:transposase
MREVIMSRKRYPKEFKIEAVKQVVDRGHSVAEVASRLGMTTHTVFFPESRSMALTQSNITRRRITRLRFAGTFTELEKQQEVMYSITLRCFTTLGGDMVSITSCHR